MPAAVVLGLLLTLGKHGHQHRSSHACIALLAGVSAAPALPLLVCPRTSRAHSQSQQVGECASRGILLLVAAFVGHHTVAGIMGSWSQLALEALPQAPRVEQPCCGRTHFARPVHARLHTCEWLRSWRRRGFWRGRDAFPSAAHGTAFCWRCSCDGCVLFQGPCTPQEKKAPSPSPLFVAPDLSLQLVSVALLLPRDSVLPLEA